ncbi:MAG: tetraacyldisaccharide 4'-kinase [Paludibacteraceae bacterium]|nr:tetraacyldisaccharide 4'-kinase [Paludibacteraceae bacterium]
MNREKTKYRLKEGLSTLLLAFPAAIYGLVTSVRNRLYDHNLLPAWQPPIKTVCIGNLAVGGTGKTPHVAYLVRLLSSRYRVAILSRGYKRRTHGFYLANEASTAFELGDEAMQQHMAFPDLPIAVCENRREGIERMIEQMPDLQIVLLDDAFQHRRVRAGLNMILTEQDALYTSDHLMPWGRLRESRRSADRADVIVISKCHGAVSDEESGRIAQSLQIKPWQTICFSMMRYGSLWPLCEQTPSMTLEQIGEQGYSVLALTGIAHPAPMIQYLSERFQCVEHMAYADHHGFTETDLAAIVQKLQQMAPPAVIITTEKDAARLQAMTGQYADRMKKSVYVLPIQVDFMSDTNMFNTKIMNYVTEDK